MPLYLWFASGMTQEQVTSVSRRGMSWGCLIRNEPERIIDLHFFVLTLSRLLNEYVVCLSPNAADLSCLHDGVDSLRQAISAGMSLTHTP